ATLQIELVGFRIGGLTLCHLPLLFAAQLWSQSLGDFAGDLLLHGECISSSTAVLLAPELFVIAHVHQFRAHDEVVTALEHAASQHSAHAQLLTGREWIAVFALVAKH